MKQDGIGRETNRNRLLISQNKLRVTREKVDIGEGMCYDECCKVCKPDDAQTCTPGANNNYYMLIF